LIILFWGACSGPFLIRSLSAADSESPVPKHLWISGGDFFTENYYLEMQENGDLIYRTTKGDRGQLISEVTIHPTPDKWRDFRANLDRINVWSWKPEYINKNVPTDGFSWKVEISYSDRKVASNGYEAMPAHDGSFLSLAGKTNDTAFKDFCAAVVTLIDRYFPSATD
jgi:hypothetical protein